MTTAVQIGETARDRADFCRCFKTGAAVFLHDGGIVAHRVVLAPVAAVKFAEVFASPTGPTHNTLSPCFTRAEVQRASFGREIDCARCDGHLEAPRYPLTWAAADRDCWPTSPKFPSRVHA